MALRPTRNPLIHCAACGEDYSVTYRKCPFCGARNDPRKAAVPAAPVPLGGDEGDLDDGYVFDGQDLFDDGQEESVPARGGKRLAGGQKEAGGPGNPLNWPRLISFLCAIVIIIAAIIIVITYLPRHKDDDPGASSPTPGNTQRPAASDPVTESDPIVDPSDAPSETVEPTDPPVDITDPPVVPTESVPGGLKGFTVNTYGTPEQGFTLKAGESWQLKLTFDPVDWSGEVTYSISDERYATVTNRGYVTNVYTGSGSYTVELTITAGGITVKMPVICRGAAAANPSDSPSADPTPSSGVTVGGKGHIVNAPAGLRVRSGPGTSYAAIASLANGTAVTVVADAGDGWYQISFPGTGGAATTGYIKGDYLSTP